MISTLKVGTNLSFNNWFVGTLSQDDYANESARNDGGVSNNVDYRFNDLPAKARKIYSVKGYWRRGYDTGGSLTPGPDDATFGIYLEAVGTGSITSVDATIDDNTSGPFTSGVLTVPTGGSAWTRVLVNDLACTFTAQRPSNIGGIVFHVGYAALLVNHSVPSSLISWIVLASLGRLTALQPHELSLVAREVHKKTGLIITPDEYHLMLKPPPKYF